MIQVRPATSADAQVLADFNLRLAKETEGKTLDADLVLCGVRNGLKQGDEVHYLVAHVDQQSSDQEPSDQEPSDQQLGGRQTVDRNIAGQLMLTREWSDWRNGWMYWLQSVYVMAEFRGQGVFPALLESAIEQLKLRSDVVGIRLYVEVENEVAIGTYRKMQFVDCGYKVMERLL